MRLIQNRKYQKDIKREMSLWNKEARKESKTHTPDYCYYEETLPYKIYRNKYVKEMLSNIKSRDRVLELGCYNGWFSLEMARRGAFVEAHDISLTAITNAKEYYLKCKVKESFTGIISYFVTDLNFPKFNRNSYDKIVIRNVLHHLINIDFLYKKLSKLLKINGMILVDDALPSRKLEAFIVGILLFVLPTDIPYSQKIKRVFGQSNILSRTQGLIDSKGSSPFEGVSGEDSFKKIFLYFSPKKIITYSAITGAISPRLNLPQPFKYLFLKVLIFFDSFFTKIRLLQGSIYYFSGVKLDNIKKK